MLGEQKWTQISHFVVSHLKFGENFEWKKQEPVMFTVVLREKCLYLELFRSAFSRIQTEYGEILRISPHSV